MKWDGRRLISLDDITYTYDSEGIRTSKSVDGVTTEYVYLNGRIVYEKRGSSELHYIYDNAGVLTKIRYIQNGNRQIYYISSNMQGDVERIYNDNGVLVAQYVYDSYGEVISIKDSSGNDITDPSHIGNINPIRYRGYYYDSESGFYYLNSRYYDPEVGRFISADGEISDIGGDIRGYNLYSYCMNNPVNMSDENGDWPGWATKVVIGTTAIAAGVAATALTCGASLAIPALIGSLKLAAAGTAIGAGAGATKHLITEKTTTGIVKAMLNGAATGYMAGGLVAGGMQVGRIALTKAGRGISFGKNKTVEMFYHTPNTKGGTILSVKKKLVKSQRTYRFRLDLDIENGLHFHSGVGKAAKKHHRLLSWLFK